MRMAYRDVPAQRAPTRLPLLCLHGLTRHSGDFEPLIDAYSSHQRVIAPDFRGRGNSDADPDLENYTPRQYACDVVALLDALELRNVIVVGTSLGGWVAGRMAMMRPGVFAGVVLNDIGPVIAPVGLARVEKTAGSLQAVSTWAEAEVATRAFYTHALPDLSPAQWRWYTHQTFHERAPGHIDLTCDRGVGAAARAGHSRLDVDPWFMFDTLCATPTLVLRGALSDILDLETVRAMHARYTALDSATISNRGHVPLLTEPEAQRALSTFMDRLADRYAVGVDPRGLPGRH